MNPPNEDRSANDIELIVVRTFNDSIEASLALARLQADGIEGFVEGLPLVGGVAGYGNALSKFDLCVKQTDAAEAASILDEIDAKRKRRADSLGSSDNAD